MPQQSYAKSIRQPGDVIIFSKNVKVDYKFLAVQNIQV